MVPRLFILFQVLVVLIWHAVNKEGDGFRAVVFKLYSMIPQGFSEMLWRNRQASGSTSIRAALLLCFMYWSCE